MKKHNILSSALIITAFIGLVMGARYVTNFDKIQLDQNEILDSGGTTRLFTGARNTVNGPIAFGNASTTASVTRPTSTTGANFANWVPVYNVGVAVTLGDVLIASNTGTGYVSKSAATNDLTTVVGVAAESIASGATGWMVPRGGGFAIVKTTGTVAIGSTLVTTTTAAGYAGADSTPTTGADFATAMEAGTASGDAILAILH